MWVPGFLSGGDQDPVMVSPNSGGVIIKRYLRSKNIKLPTMSFIGPGNHIFMIMSLIFISHLFFHSSEAVKMVPLLTSTKSNASCTPWMRAELIRFPALEGIPSTCGNTPVCTPSLGGSQSSLAVVNSTGLYQTTFSGMNCNGTVQSVVNAICYKTPSSSTAVQCLDTDTLPFFVTVYSDAQCSLEQSKSYYASAEVFLTNFYKGIMKSGATCQNVTSATMGVPTYAMPSSALSLALPGNKPSAASSVHPGVGAVLCACISLLTLIFNNFRN